MTTADSSSPLALRKSTRLAVHSTDDSKGECQLALNSNLLASRFDNTILDAQYEVADGCLLAVLGSDSPWDVTASLYLLDSTGRVIDAIHGGGMFVAGGFAEVGLDAAGLTFVFPGVENRYRLSVSQRAAWRSPLPSGWRYQRWWATHRLQLLQLNRPT